MRCVPGGFAEGVTTELAMFKKFASRGIKHRQSLWTAHLHQCLAEVCKPVNSAGCMVLQSPAKPMGSAVDQMDLVVGMW
jgi:hypothetical protein